MYFLFLKFLVQYLELKYTLISFRLFVKPVFKKHKSACLILDQ